MRFARASGAHPAREQAAARIPEALAALQVWKANTQGICGNLVRMGDGSIPRPELAPFSFTFVREPVSHFVAGFSERASRWNNVSNTGTQKVAQRGTERCPFYAFNVSDPADKQAEAYIEDTLFGRLGRCKPEGAADDMHVRSHLMSVRTAGNGRPPEYPSAHIDVIGRLEHFREVRPVFLAQSIISCRRELAV